MEKRDDRHWHKLPVPLAWVCGLDECPADNALSTALGDRYLYSRNAMFRRIRDAALGLGYRFSSEDTPLWRDYQVFGLTTLHRILSEKIIPCVDTLNPLRRLLAVNPKAAMPPAFLLANLRANYAFHESAHGVAQGVLERFAKDLRALAPDDKDRFVLEAILAESFANSVERLASAFGNAQISDTLFYALNSYVFPREQRSGLFGLAGTSVGAQTRFAILFMSSVEANLTAGPPCEEQYERVAQAADCPPSGLEIARRLTDAGFDLSGGFREDTTPAYFSMLGYGRPYLALAGAKWLGDPAHGRFARELASALFDAAGA